MQVVNNKIELTFSGCGFLGIYHLGVVESFRIKVPNFLEKIDKVYGCSAGALVGVMLLCGISMRECLAITKEIVLELKELRLGPLNPTVKFREAMRKNFENMLPRNAHKIVSGRLFVSCTSIPSRENVIISDFNTRNELINVLIASSYIPGYSGMDWPTYRGKRYVDGGLSNNLPKGGTDTIGVCPFSGKIDISPAGNRYSFTTMIVGHALEMSIMNLIRLMRALFPLSNEKLDEVFRNGRRDADIFLDNHPELTGRITAVDDEIDQTNNNRSEVAGVNTYYNRVAATVGTIKQSLIENCLMKQMIKQTTTHNLNRCTIAIKRKLLETLELINKIIQATTSDRTNSSYKPEVKKYNPLMITLLQI